MLVSPIWRNAFGILWKDSVVSDEANSIHPPVDLPRIERAVREILAAEIPDGEVIAVKTKAFKIVILIARGGIDLACG